ncbi:protein phosphatase inhibitor 2 [Parasteatoda tepidariorum]|uniref:protein phosphatase inhibitor 2 n=1 Tax=Parasteatoda tepidariorum TaxID=114398 RepID=UPI00077F8F96|nr:protein phosphatase inhibitor 2 [Parasteatoda tepidariorum]
MTENLLKKPAKGILKSSTSFNNPEANKNNPLDIKWDEMNILQTLHPPDKDYGHMKIDEPKTPYSYYEDQSGKEISGHGDDTLDAELLAKKINLCSEKNEKPVALESPCEEDNEEEDETEEERAQRSAFEYKRKMHYNEFYAVKLARKLIEKDGDPDEADDEN